MCVFLHHVAHLATKTRKNGPELELALFERANQNIRRSAGRVRLSIANRYVVALW